jgi:ketosteroid isomerase-like protein
MNRIFATTLMVLLSLCAYAQTNEAAAKEPEVEKTLANFVQAFDNLDWDAFRNFFADHATVFYPRAFPERADGRAEFERTFRKVFEQIRGGQTKAPYMDIQPRNLRIQIAGDAAVVTFHLDDRTGFVNRRTLILQKFAAGWKIIHLHASEVSIPGAPVH